MQFEGIVISAGITIFSLGLFLVSFVSYRKYKNPKLLFINFVFIVLLIKGILFSVSLFFPEFSFINSFLYSIYGGLFDLAILVLLFIATLKR